ncbi:MAG: hypothetical protein ABIK15_06925 [Pseudomonadota bacterium]
MKYLPDIFKKVNDIAISEAVKNALDSLEVKNVSFIFDESKCDNFYNTIREIAKKSFYCKSDTLNNESLQTAKWALELWGEAVKAEQPERMFIAYLILNYLEYPIDTLQITWDDEKRKEISKKIAMGFIFNIDVPENADYPHQSQFKQYREGLDTKNFGKLLAFFSSLERGIGIHGINPALPKLIQLICRIHKDGILLLLNRGEPALAELVIQSLQPSDVAKVLAENFDAQHDFPLARGLEILSVYYKDQLNKGCKVNIPYCQLGTVLEKLKKQPTWNITFKQLSNAATLKWNPVFHYCCGLCSENSPEFIEQYLETVEFSLEENDYGNSFYQALIRSGKDEVVLRASELVFVKYCDYLNKYKGQYVLNRATSYFNFIVIYVQQQSKDVTGYSALLAEQFNRVDGAISSWFPNDAYYELKILYLFIAANFILNYSLSIDAPIVKRIDAFVCDERHEGSLSDVPAVTMIDLLTKPTSIASLTMIYDNGKPTEVLRNWKEA